MKTGTAHEEKRIAKLNTRFPDIVALDLKTTGPDPAVPGLLKVKDTATMAV